MGSQLCEHQNPPEEPPPLVGSEMLWRLSVRLYHDHSMDRRLPDPTAEPAYPSWVGEAPAPAQACVRCGQLWPCSGRRLAELGLNAASTAGVRLQSLVWLSDSRQPSPEGTQP
jgi:hypothetical protein